MVSTEDFCAGGFFQFMEGPKSILSCSFQKQDGLLLIFSFLTLQSQLRFGRVKWHEGKPSQKHKYTLSPRARRLWQWVWHSHVVGDLGCLLQSQPRRKFGSGLCITLDFFPKSKLEVKLKGLVQTMVRMETHLRNKHLDLSAVTECRIWGRSSLTSYVFCQQDCARA